MPDFRTSVLELVASDDYRPVKPAVIAKRLGLSSDGLRDLKKTIKHMIKAGELACQYIADHLSYRVVITQDGPAARALELIVRREGLPRSGRPQINP